MADELNGQVLPVHHTKPHKNYNFNDGPDCSDKYTSFETTVAATHPQHTLKGEPNVSLATKLSEPKEHENIFFCIYSWPKCLPCVENSLFVFQRGPLSQTVA